VVQGQVNVDDYTGGFKMAAEQLYDMDMARDAFAERLVLRLDREQLSGGLLEELDGILRQADRGSCPVWFHVTTESATGMLRAADGLGIALRQELLSRLRDVMGEHAVAPVYRKTPLAGPEGEMDSAA
jgi:DNA polymerase-3 subunit alpha